MLWGKKMNLAEVRKISMLNVEVLQRLQDVGARGSGGVFEVGPYIGGSTIAMASGHMGRRKHVAIDIGIPYPDQPYLPSSDVIGDLKRNLERFGVRQHVSIYEGWSNDPAIYGPAMQELGSIGLFFFDANGAVQEQLSICAPFLEDNCTIVLDDITGDHGKAGLVMPALKRLMAKGALIEDEIIDATWFGRLGKIDRSVLTYFEPDTGHAWRMPAPDPAVSRIELFEDGKPLGPGGAMHVDIRERGLGAWSHWDFASRFHVLFSTSDNSDPNENGRRYDLKVYPR